MHKIIKLLIKSSLLFFIVTSIHAQERAIVGHAVSVSGQVLVRNDTTDQVTLKKLIPGAPIAQGDVINTSSHGSVKLLMSDQTILDLGGSTLFKVDEYLLTSKVADRKVNMTLQYGKVRTSVQVPVGKSGYFKIHTKAAVMGVRGTEFIVQSSLDALQAGTQESSFVATGGSSLAQPSNSTQTQVTVVQGTVEVGANQTIQNNSSPPIEVGAGKQLNALISSNGVQTTTVQALSSSDLQRVVAEGRVIDQTFTQAVSLNSSDSHAPVSTALTAVNTAVKAPNQGFLPSSVVGIGTPGLASVPTVPNQRQVGNTVHLQVVFKR